MPPPAQGRVSMVPFTTATFGVPRELRRSLPMWRRPPPRGAPKSSVKASGPSMGQTNDGARLISRWPSPAAERLARGHRTWGAGAGMAAAIPLSLAATRSRWAARSVIVTAPGCGGGGVGRPRAPAGTAAAVTTRHITRQRMTRRMRGSARVESPGPDRRDANHDLHAAPSSSTLSAKRAPQNSLRVNEQSLSHRAEKVLLEELQRVTRLLHPVVPLPGAVALVGEEDELRPGPAPLQRRLQLESLAHRHPGVVGALDDEERPPDPVDVRDRRQPA